jgi:hypothetical protein
LLILLGKFLYLQGTAYRRVTIRENLSTEDFSSSGFTSLKRVVENAKLYYKDPDALQRSIDEILGK